MSCSTSRQMAGGNRRAELQAFDDTKAGVKGLIDAGITKLPEIFIHRELDLSTTATDFSLPVIDLHGVQQDLVSRVRVVDEVRRASESWGFFQIINHGVPESIMADILAAIARFNEQDVEIKKQFYTRDTSRKFGFNSNFDLFSAPASNWRDTVNFTAAPNPPPPEELPLVFREIMAEYSNQMMGLGKCLFKLLSEGLGLNPEHLLDLECADSLLILSNYYPQCPEPTLTLGITNHSDNDFMTILLQDSLGGLQIRHQDNWVDVAPLPGALIINMGDLMQLVTNDKFKSAEHRVLVNNKGPRVSVASFFGRNSGPSRIVHYPIKELLSDENPAKYMGTTADEFSEKYKAKGLDGTSALLHYRIY